MLSQLPLGVDQAVQCTLLRQPGSPMRDQAASPQHQAADKQRRAAQARPAAWEGMGA